MADEVKTVEVSAEPEKTVAPVPVVPTREELKGKGWSKAEMDLADKRGMLNKPEEKKTEAKVEAKTEPVKKEEAKSTIPAPVEPEKKTDSSLPDFTFKTPEQEKVFLDAFGTGTPQRAMYFRMKNERLSRQRAEGERDKLALEVQMFKDQKLNLEDRPAVETDEDGNVIDPEDKPLTMKQLKAMQKAEQEELNKRQTELTERSSKVAESMKVQEEYAKSILPDFDETVKLATDLVNNIDQIPDNWKKNKVVKLLKDLQVTAASADKYGIDDYTASMIAYELGQLHPKYGQPTEPDGTEDQNPKQAPKSNGTLTPEQMKRIEENTQRRASSASLPGSNGRRTISVDDISIKDVLRMTPEERFKFKKDHPEKMTKLLRG